MADYILKTYLEIGSAMEMNIPRSEARYEEIQQAILNKKLNRELFDYLIPHCIINMQDIFERFKINKNVREYLEGFVEKPVVPEITSE